jgi:hypothetical protein
LQHLLARASESEEALAGSRFAVPLPDLKFLIEFAAGTLRNFKSAARPH